VQFVPTLFKPPLHASFVGSSLVVRPIELDEASDAGQTAGLFSLAAKVAEGEIETFNLAEPALPLGPAAAGDEVRLERRQSHASPTLVNMVGVFQWLWLPAGGASDELGAVALQLPFSKQDAVRCDPYKASAGAPDPSRCESGK